MKLTWKYILCLFGRHDPGVWLHYNRGVQVQHCNRCGARTGYRKITTQPRDY